MGHDGETLAFVEVRTRTAREDQAALTELSVTAEKHQVMARTARRFEVVAIEELPGSEAAQGRVLSTDVQDGRQSPSQSERTC